MEALSHRFYLILFVGALYGLLAGVMMFAFTELASALVAAALTFASLHLLNRFLHLDGLSDLGDGMVCGGDAERRRAAMKDSKTGAGGVGYALVFSLLSFAALASITGQTALLFVPLVAEVMNKNALVVCAAHGNAREGLVNIIISHTGKRQAAVSLIIAALLSMGLMFLLNYMMADPWDLYTMGAVVLSGLWTSVAVGLLVYRTAEKNFGAVNGDVLGATNEICRPLVIIVMILVVML